MIKKELFYFCLDDKYLQEQLCNLKGDNITFKMFYDEACIAEQKRKSFQEIGVSSSHLDSASGVSVSKWEPKYGGKSESGGGRGKSKWSVKSVKPGSGSVAGRGTREAHMSAHNPVQTPYSENPSTEHTGARSKKKKVPGACFMCQQYGHYANKCPDRLQSQNVKKCQVSSVKKAEIDEEDTPPVREPEFQFHSLEIVAGETTVKRGERHQVDVKATSVKTLYATNQVSV